MTAYAWDLLPPSAQSQILWRVQDGVATFHIDVSSVDIELLCRLTVDALGKTDAVEAAVSTAYEEGYEAAEAVDHDAAYAEGYEAGNANGYSEGYEASKEEA